MDETKVSYWYAWWNCRGPINNGATHIRVDGIGFLCSKSRAAKTLDCSTADRGNVCPQCAATLKKIQAGTYKRRALPQCPVEVGDTVTWRSGLSGRVAFIHQDTGKVVLHGQFRGGLYSETFRSLTNKIKNGKATVTRSASVAVESGR